MNALEENKKTSGEQWATKTGRIVNLFRVKENGC